MKQTRQYFTLIEVLTVAAIIAILAGITVGVVGMVNNKNAEARTLATIKALELAMGQYQSDYGCVFTPAGYSVESAMPVSFELPEGTPDKPDGTLFKYLDQKLLTSATKTEGGKRYFVDGWDRPLIFRFPGRFNKLGYDLGSAGADGKIGDGKNGTEDTTSMDEKKPSDIPDNNKDAEYSKKFGTGDDITNFLRKD